MRWERFPSGLAKKSSIPRQVGRYTLLDAIASGGMATVHLGRLSGTAGFSKTVAIKRLHPQFAESGEVVSMLVDEARLVARIAHPNVVPMLDVFADGSELYLVMEYVVGESLGRLLRLVREREQLVPIPIATGILAGTLHGLHAAHEARSETGESLGIVHRDVSPQNIMVGTDGLSRVLDFGVAKARGRIQTTREGQVKGKLAYMAPEQVRSGSVTRRSDVFSCAVVLWETLTCRRLFLGENEGHTLNKLLEAPIERPSRFVPGVSPELDALVMKGLSRDPDKRFATAREFALALERDAGLAPAWEIGAWVELTAADSLGARARVVESVGTSASDVRPAESERANEETAPDIDAKGQEAGTAPSLSLNNKEQTQRRVSSRVLLGLGLAGLLAAVAGFALRQPPASSPVAPVASASTPEVAGSVPSPAARVELVIETKPAGAHVVLDGVDRGTTPATLALTRSNARTRLELTLPGYAAHSESLRLDVAQRLIVTLNRQSQPTTIRGPRPSASSAPVPKIHRFD